jgi:WD40 repeat protein
MILRCSFASGRICLGIGILLPLLATAKASAEPVAPEDSLARLMVQDGHPGGVSRAVFSPDGKLALTGSLDRTARLWDVETGKQLHILAGHTTDVRNVVFSPDGKLVLTGSSDNTARLWDVQTGKRLQSLQGHTAGVWSAAFSPDGKSVITGSADKTARLWDVQTGKFIHGLLGHTDAVGSASFSTDGKFVLTGGRDKTARLWDAQTGQQIHGFLGHTGAVLRASFSPDGKLVLTGSEDNTARIWEAQTGKQIHSLQGHTAEIRSAVFSPDGKLVLTASHDSTARLWDAQTGKQLRILEGHKGKILSAAFSPDGKSVLTGGEDKTARLWDVETGMDIHRFHGHTLEVSTVAFSPNSKRVLTGSLDKTARLWDVQTGMHIHSLLGYSEAVLSVSISPDGKLLLTGGQEITARLWNLQTGKQFQSLQGHTAEVRSVAFSPDGKFVLTGSADSTARLWNAETGKQLQIFLGHTSKVESVAFSPNGKLVLTGGQDKTARLWDAQTGKQIRTFQGHSSAVLSVALSPDGMLILTASLDKTARLWDVRTGKQVHSFQGHTDRVGSVAFSPDGKRVVTGSLDRTARLWDVTTGEQIHSFQEPSRILNVAFSPDGKLVLTGSQDKMARLWEVETGKQIRTFVGHTDWLQSAVFSPDGKLVLTGSQDKTTRIWDVQTGKELCRLVSFTDGTWAVVDKPGRYDASNGGEVEGLHWVVGLEPVALNQLKERYYDPGLLAKYLGRNKEPFREVKDLGNPKLYPDVQVIEPTRDNPRLTIKLTNRGGGIGRVVVKLNGKEITADARPMDARPEARTMEITLDLTNNPLLKRGGRNVIEVQAFNAEGYLRSRGMQRLFEAEGKVEKEDPHLWAIVVGVSKYSNPVLELRYAAKDAEDFANALQIASTRLFCKDNKDNVHQTLLTTSQPAAKRQPTRENLVNALKAAQKAKPGDVVVIYLAGHGVNLGGPDGDFYYLTRDAQSAELKDPDLRRNTSLSSAELTEYLKQIPAQKQVLILDTCASGAAIKNLTEKRDVPGSQVRALERIKDRTGLHILAGCAADAVSYETTRYGQGILTYSLLLGMRGAKLRADGEVDVVDLFGFAADKVPELACDIGGVQRPVIASPVGSSFDIGRLTLADQAKIPLQQVRPLVLRAIVQEEARARDSLELSNRINERLRSASSSGRGAALVYLDATAFPGAIAVGGRYKVVGNKVTLAATMFVGEKDLASFQVEGDKVKLDELADRLVAEIEKRLASP